MKEMEYTLDNTNFENLSMEDLENIDGGLAFTAGALVALGCFGVGTVAGLIWG
ncbi:class IIb bacteriocin, lactobin A/cerein 7B family [Clostridium perfringens]|uniref:class IIb bacteriocin, lactobin A/cerein 7B family n=1 Tax=Clostridium perfringens TaxID=1502 RepID=UPI0024BC3873|nr:class IIb bacteriocin, lactobin A/cerein 7B family [Clostridium perfringens]